MAIDDASISQIGRWPWDRSVHAGLITKLKDAGAVAIGYDVNFPEASDETSDATLADALKSAGNVVLPVELTLATDHGTFVFDPKATVSPLSVFSSSAAATGHSNTPPDADGVVRRVPIGVHAPDGTEVSAFAVQVLSIAAPSVDVRLAPLDPFYQVILNFDGPPRKTFRTVSAVDVLRGNVPTSLISGKTVFVGATASDLHDDRMVPTSDGAPMPGVEIHATMFDTLKDGRWLQPVPPLALAGIIVLLGLLLGLVVGFLRARFSVPLALVVWAGCLVAAFMLFDRGWIADVVWPSITVVFAYAAVTLERRVTADRERARIRAAFSRYVSPSVVSLILKDPSRLKLGGEKRRMSVLFSDIRGFTSIAESMPPEKLVVTINAYLTHMTGIVFEQDGVLDKYIGDAVMAFWNAPLDQADHALRAVKTALAMQTAVADMNREKELPDGLAIRIGIGINTGDMIVGNMGSEARFDYTVIGDNVNLASRLEGLTKEYGVGILVTEATIADIKDKVLARRIDRVAVKGKNEPVVVYEVLGIEGQVSPVERKLAADFEAALDAYFKKDFDGAIRTCEAIRAARPDDGPCATLIERSKHMKEHAPGPDWNGVWVMHTK